jgi:succinate dehydrogenase hydrophobic anchor subunit
MPTTLTQEVRQVKEAVWNRVEPASAIRRSGMSAESVIRLSGLALVIGCVVSVVFRIVGNLFYGSTTDYANQPVYITSGFVLAAASILLLLGLPGVIASRARGFGAVGLIGMALVFTAIIMVGVFANLYSATVDPWLATRAPSLANSFGPPAFFAYFNIAELVLVVGSVLLAIPVLRGRVSPRWPAIVLLLSVVIGVVFFFLIPSLPSTLGPSLMATVPDILLWVALAGLGYQAWSKPTPLTD